METAANNSISSLLKHETSLSQYFSNQFASLTPWKILIGLALGCLVGLIIAFVYKRCYRGVLYSPTFAMTLMMLTLITTPVVMCIKSDIALSMGMVGALSIVRFRTAVKDPMDTAYMFWALTMGILLGAELYVHALMVVLVISIILFLMSFLHLGKGNAYLLVVHYDDYAEQDITQLLRRSLVIYPAADDRLGDPVFVPAAEDTVPYHTEEEKKAAVLAFTRNKRSGATTDVAPEADYLYYTEVLLRIDRKLLSAAD